jgi:hypothetical protein
VTGGTHVLQMMMLFIDTCLRLVLVGETRYGPSCKID